MLSVAEPHDKEDKAEPGNLCCNHLLLRVSEGAVHVGVPIFCVRVPVFLKCKVGVANLQDFKRDPIVKSTWRGSPKLRR